MAELQIRERRLVQAGKKRWCGCISIRSAIGCRFSKTSSAMAMARMSQLSHSMIFWDEPEIKYGQNDRIWRVNTRGRVAVVAVHRTRFKIYLIVDRSLFFPLCLKIIEKILRIDYSATANKLFSRLENLRRRDIWETASCSISGHSEFGWVAR